MNIFEIIDYNLQVLNTAHLINSIIRSSIVVILGFISLILIYYILPKKVDGLSIDDLNSLKQEENLPIVLGIMGFFILGTTGYAYALSLIINVYYPIIVTVWVNLSFLFLTAICIKYFQEVRISIVPIIIGWTGATGGIIAIILRDVNPTLGLIFETIALSFLPSLAFWFLNVNVKTSDYTQKIILIFGILLLSYGIIKLCYFLLYISGIKIGILEFLYNITPTILDVICIFGPTTLCFLKCQND